MENLQIHNMIQAAMYVDFSDFIEMVDKTYLTWQPLLQCRILQPAVAIVLLV